MLISYRHVTHKNCNEMAMERCHDHAVIVPLYCVKYSNVCVICRLATVCMLKYELPETCGIVADSNYSERSNLGSIDFNCSVDEFRTRPYCSFVHFQLAID